MEYSIQTGINPEHKEEAARLYAIAFQSKFLKLLGSPEKVTQLLSGAINPDRGICALSHSNELIGIAGFELNNSSLTNLKLKDFTRNYGLIRGTFKLVLSAILFHRKPDHKAQLLMDGIAVKEGNRGKGIGKQLFIALEKLARQNKITSIKLDVIDENPDAKKLYESIGFITTKYTKTPAFVYKLIGVGGVSTMVKNL